MNGRRGDLGSTSMALTLESFWRYASSTCQRTSSDREPTLRSSKFWGGRRLASRRCSASYKFVCCGLLRAWCSLGLPIGVEGSPLRGSHYCWAALLNKVAGSSSTPQGDRWARRSSRLSQRADSAARSYGWMGFGDASGDRGSLLGLVDGLYGRLLGRLRFVSGSCQIHIDQKPVLARRMRQGQHS